MAVTTTELGSVRGQEGFFHYRDHDATTIAADHPLEAGWFLLLEGRLPSPAELDRFRAEVGDARQVDDAVLDLARIVGERVAAPHHALQAMLPLAMGPAPSWLDLDHAEQRSLLIRAAAMAPTLLGATAAAGRGDRPLPAEPDRTHAGDWLRMATGREPTDAQTRMVEIYLASTMDHGFNASTFTTRVVTSTGADPVSALSAGVGALSGPLHGGAPARALQMIDDIGDPASTEAWILARLEAGEKIMGFGHAVYRAEDPRSLLLRDVALDHGGPLVEAAVEIERRALAVLRSWKPDAVIVTNVEFYAGVVLHLAGLPAERFTSTFTVSRILGWVPHVLEQAANNKIIRPSAAYVGPEPRRRPRAGHPGGPALAS